MKAIKNKENLFSKLSLKSGTSAPKMRWILKLLNHLPTHPAFSFDHYIEGALLLMSQVDKSFIDMRDHKILYWLLEQLPVIEKTSSVTAQHEACQLHTFCHTLPFPFQSKKVLGIFLILDRVSIDDENIKKIVLENHADISIVEGSFFYLYNHRMQTIKMYFEIQKNDAFFSDNEILHLEQTLPKLILSQAQANKTPLVIPGNREILIKSFNWIMQEISKNDLPQAFIHFSKAMGDTFQFSAIVCGIKKNGLPSLKTLLDHSDIHIESSTTYEEQGIIKEGVIMEVHIPVDATRSLTSARKKSSNLIQSLLGEFRDVNGGLLEKIEENFKLFSTQVKAPLPTLQTFFSSITPQERQATAPIDLLEALYNLQIQQKKETHETHYAIYENKALICISLKIPGNSFEKEFRYALSPHFPQIVFASTHTQDAKIISCALLKNSENKSMSLNDLSFSFYQNWLEKKELKQILRLSSNVYFTSFDPRIGTEEETSYLHKILFEGLMRIGPDGSLKNGIAHKVQVSQEGRHYRFFLRKSFWSNGLPLTAHDFVHSWTTSLQPNFLSPLSYLFYNIENAQEIKEGLLPSNTLGIQAFDDYTLDVKLSSPTSYFLELCAISLFSPISKVIDTQNPSWSKAEGSNYICNGPFYIEKKENRDKLTLKKNPFYWDNSQIKLEKVKISFFSKEKSLDLFNKKHIDALLYPLYRSDNSNLIKVESTKKWEGLVQTKYLCFNCSNPVFRNRKMRHALSLAIQREQLVSQLSVKNIPHYSPYSPHFTQITSQRESEENIPHAQDLFARELQKQGTWEKIQKQQIYVSPRYELLANLIVDQINAVFNLDWKTSVILDFNKLYELLGDGKFPITIYGWIDWIQDPSYFLEIFSSSKNTSSRCFWTNQALKSLIQKIRKIDSQETRSQLHSSAEHILHEEKPMIPLLYTSTTSFLHQNIQHSQKSKARKLEIRYMYKE